MPRLRRPSSMMPVLLAAVLLSADTRLAGQPRLNSAANQPTVPDLRERLAVNVAALSKFPQVVSNLELVDSADPRAREEVVGSIENIIRSLDFMRRDVSARKVTLSDEILSQLNGDAELLISTLDGLERSRPRLDASGRKRIANIDSDVTLKMSRFDEIRGPEDATPRRFPEVRIVVRALLSDGRLESNLRVYYVGEVFYDTPLEKEYRKSFDRLTSPSEPTYRELPEADYRVWAGRGANPTPVSEVKSLRVLRRSAAQETVVDLLVIK